MRLRLLTTPAQSLRFAVRDYIESLDDLGAISLESDKALREELWRRREAFIAAVKALLSR